MKSKNPSTKKKFTFYVTLGYGHPGSPGYIKASEVAASERDARDSLRRRLRGLIGLRYAMVYASIDRVHPLDKTYRGTPEEYAAEFYQPKPEEQNL